MFAMCVVIATARIALCLVECGAMDNIDCMVYIFAVAMTQRLVT